MQEKNWDAKIVRVIWETKKDKESYSIATFGSRFFGL